MNTAPLNTTAINGSLPTGGCQGRGAVNEDGLNASALNASGCTAKTAPAQNFYTGTARAPLTLRQWAAGKAAAAALLRTYVLGQTRLFIDGSLTAREGLAFVTLDAAVYGYGQAISPLHLSAGRLITAGAARAPIAARAFAQSSGLALTIIAQVAKKPVFGDLNTAYSWHPRVLVSGVMVDTTGEISVSGEEASAMQASFSLADSPRFAINQEVRISIVINDFESILFNGKITEIQFSPHTGISTYIASDLFQNFFDKKIRTVIEGITGTSIPTPGNTDEGYRYLSHCLESQLFNVHLNLFGVPVRSGLLGGVPYPKPVLTAIDGTESLSLVRADQIINKIPVTFDASWVRIFKVETRMAWQSPWTLCQFFGFNMAYIPTLPSAGSIKPMIDGLGWQVEAYAETPITSAGGKTIYCPSPTGPRPVIALAGNTALNQINFELSRRASRTMRWQFPILITADSIPIFGEHPQPMASTYTAPETDSAWLAAPSQVPDTVLDITDQNRVKCHDQFDFDNDFMPYLKKEGARYARIIVESHRQTRASITTPILPDLTREHELTIDAPAFTARGKVTSLRHRLNTDTGSATTELTIAIVDGNSAAFAYKLNIDAFKPDRVATLTDDIPPTEYLPTWVGGTASSPPEPENAAGWIMNANPPAPNASLYKTTGFIVNTPDISLPDQANVDGINQVNIAIGLPKSTLVYK